MLEAVNIFHYEQFWRLKGAREVSHRCGGILTLILVLLLGGIIGYEIVALAQRRTITASSESQINFTSPLVNISTYQEDPNMQPFMAAIVLLGATGNSYSPKDYKVSARYSKQIYDTFQQSYIYSYTDITMQSCTPNHFSKLPNIYEKFNSWGMNYWLCLPINSSFEVGGNVLENIKYIRMDVQCSDTNPNCSQSRGTLLVNLITLNTFVNPNSHSQPLIPYFNRRQAVFTPSFTTRNFIYLNKNILSTDSSLTPFEKYDQKICFQEGSYTNSNSYASQVPLTTYYLILSGKTITSSRSYLKILTSLSFIGGLVAPLLTFISVASMITKFGSFVYQMNFAKQFFKNRASMKINYFGFIQQVVYSFLCSFFREPDWQLPKQREQLKNTTIKLLDVVFLQRRVALLERAITVLFQKHQLIGLYLVRTTTKEEADTNYFYHQLRRNLLLYFREKQKANKHKPLDIKLKPTQRYLSKLSKLRQNESLYRDNNTLLSSTFRQPNSGPKQQLTMNHKQSHPKEKMESAVGLVKSELREMPVQELKQCQAQDFRDQFDQQLQQRQYLEKQFVGEIVKQLGVLQFQARDNRGDWRSKRIYQCLDQKIKTMQAKVVADDDQHI